MATSHQPKLLALSTTVLALLLAACSGSPVAMQDVGDPAGGLLVRTDPDFQGDGAEILGALTIENGCVFLSSSQPAQSNPVVIWPYGTTWQDDPPGIVLPNGEFAAVGTELTASGGIGSRVVNDMSDEALAVLNACRDLGRSPTSLGGVAITPPPEVLTRPVTFDDFEVFSNGEKMSIGLNACNATIADIQTTQTDEVITVEVTESYSPPTTNALGEEAESPDCQDGITIDLERPYAGQRVVDGSTGEEAVNPQ